MTKQQYFNSSACSNGCVSAPFVVVNQNKPICSMLQPLIKLSLRVGLVDLADFHASVAFLLYCDPTKHRPNNQRKNQCHGNINVCRKDFTQTAKCSTGSVLRDCTALCWDCSAPSRIVLTQMPTSCKRGLMFTVESLKLWMTACKTKDWAGRCSENTRLCGKPLYTAHYITSSY